MSRDDIAVDRRIHDIEQALRRAAANAEKLARETGTPLVLWRDGRVVEVFSATEATLPPGQADQTQQ